MASLVIVVVLVAAVLHAGWNALAKALPDRLVTSTLVGVVYLVGGGVAAIFVPRPTGSTWAFLLASSVLQVLYLLLLTAAYRHGEFSRVYPVARGMSPLLVTVVSLTVLNEHLAPAQLVGVVVLLAALASLIFVGGRPRRGDGLGLAAMTGVLIAAYTMVDGIGVRHSGAPLSYAAWLFLLQGPMLIITCRLLAGPRLWRDARRHSVLGGVVGTLSLLAYAMVVWAQNHGSLALVAALRETSVVFAGVIGALFLREKLGPVRLVATVLAATGIIVMEGSAATSSTGADRARTSVVAPAVPGGPHTSGATASSASRMR